MNFEHVPIANIVCEHRPEEGDRLVCGKQAVVFGWWDDDYDTGMYLCSEHLQLILKGQEKVTTKEQIAAIAIAESIRRHYISSGKNWPSPIEALLWTVTEIAEAGELLLMYDPSKWVRNNPEAKEEYSDSRFCEELGDAIMMLVVAGLKTGFNPLHSLVQKLAGKDKP